MKKQKILTNFFLGLLTVACQGGGGSGGSANAPSNDVSTSPIKVVIDCPDNFVAVQGSDEFSTEAFCVSKYEMSAFSEEYILPVRSDYLDTPLVTSHNAAQAACQYLGENYDLISNQQWQIIAREIEDQDENFIKLSTPDINTGGDIIYKVMALGNSYDGDYLGEITESTESVKNVLNPDDDYDQISEELDSDVYKLSKRTLKLKSGDMIWDFTGNLSEHVSDEFDQSLLSDEGGYASIYVTSFQDLSEKYDDKSFHSVFSSNKRYEANDKLDEYFASYGLGSIDIELLEVESDEKLYIRRGKDGLYSVKGFFTGVEDLGGFRCVYQADKKLHTSTKDELEDVIESELELIKEKEESESESESELEVEAESKSI